MTMYVHMYVICAYVCMCICMYRCIINDDRSFGTKRSNVTSSTPIGKLKNIAEKRSGTQTNLQQTEDHRCSRSHAAIDRLNSTIVLDVAGD